MQKILLILLIVISTSIWLNSQTLEWVKKIGGQSIDIGESISIDKQNNIYSVGIFYGTVDFDLGPGIFNLTTSGFGIFILKQNIDGDFIWAKKIDLNTFSYNAKEANIVADSNGNCYITISFLGTIDVDPGINIFNIKSKGDRDFCVLKLDNNGNFIWVKTFGGIGWDIVRSIALDQSGNVYLTGHFRETIDFDPGPAQYNLNSSGQNDIYILKLDSNGNFLWAKSIGGIDWDRGYSIEIDQSENIYITGLFNGMVDFNPGSGNYYLSSSGGTDVFILKLDTNGNFLWAKSIGGIGGDEGFSIEIYLSGNVYISGWFQDTVDFDPGSGNYYLSSSGGSDAFILKLDTNGNFLWVKSIGGIDRDQARSIILDQSENVYISGWFQDTVDFNPGPGQYILSSSGNVDIFILKLNNTGNFVWGISIGGIGVDVEHSIISDQLDNIYLIGSFEETVDFDPGIDTFFLSSNGYFDAFILKLSQCPTSFDTMQVQTCGSYTWIDGKTYTESTDTAEYILTNAQGCDSIVLLDLTIYKKDSLGMQTTACNEYIWKEDTLKNTGIYRYDTLNIYGCDSTVTLDLTINKSSDSRIVKTSCDSYIWHDSSYTQSGVYRFDTLNAVGCDSIITLDLTLNNSSSTTLDISACESYTWHDNIYTSSGIYRFDTLNITGCDSIITLNLTIVDKIEKLDTMYICQGDTIEVFDNEIWEEALVSRTFTNQKGCDSIQNIQVMVNPLPVGTITESICEGDSIFIVNRWISEEGIYIIHKENQGECDSLYTVDITIRPLKYSYDTIKICEGDTIEVFGFEISSETDVEQSYVGSNDCDSTVYMHIGVLPVSSSQSQITLCPGDSILITGDWIKTSGEYQEHHTGINGCDSISNIQISVLQEQDAPIINTDCENARIIASFDAITSGWNILWSTGDTTNSTSYTTEQQAYAVLTTSSGCELRYDFDIPQMPDLSTLPEFRDTTVKTEEKIEVSIELDTSEWQINWSPEGIIDCSQCQNIIISPIQDVQITATFTHISGCVYTRSFNITIDNKINWDIPNIFTPDGDGINDTWTFPVPKEINIVSCSIFDRWGEKIYHSGNNNQINWDGTFKGSSVLSGVYIYIIEYLDSNGKKQVIAGDVTVVK